MPLHRKFKMNKERKTIIVKLVYLKVKNGKLEETLKFLPYSEKEVNEVEDSYPLEFDNYLNR